MKIWIDILTPKQLLFSEPIIKKLKKKHDILCTSREYREVTELAKIRNLDLIFVGKHGGKKNFDKLMKGTDRIKKLTKLVYRYNPDLLISFQSPEASRVAFGLGIRHIGFADSAHATAVMKLTVPFLDKLLIPWIMEKEKFAKFGIIEKNIIQYKAIDAAIISKRKISKHLEIEKKKKIVIIRMAEEHASYNKFSNESITPIIKEILKELPDFRIIVLARYIDQIKFLKNKFRNKIEVPSKVVDSKSILRYADVFIGSGGTMTAEAAFLGIPTVSYSKNNDYDIDVFLEKRKIVVRESDPKKIPKIIQNLTSSNNSNYKLKIQKLMKSMEDPIGVLEKILNF